MYGFSVPGNFTSVYFCINPQPKKEIHLLTLMPSQMYMTFFLQTNTNKQGALKRNDSVCVCMMLFQSFRVKKSFMFLKKYLKLTKLPLFD